MRVGMCVPRDAVFTFQQGGGIHRLKEESDWHKVTSLEDLDDVDDKMGTKLFHDTDKG